MEVVNKWGIGSATSMVKFWLSSGNGRYLVNVGIRLWSFMLRKVAFMVFISIRRLVLKFNALCVLQIIMFG